MPSVWNPPHIKLQVHTYVQVYVSANVFLHNSTLLPCVNISYVAVLLREHIIHATLLFMGIGYAQTSTWVYLLLFLKQISASTGRGMVCLI